MFIGGILTNSLAKVYGMAEGGVSGYDCSVIWLLSEKEINEFTNYKSIDEIFLTK